MAGGEGILFSMSLKPLFSVSLNFAGSSVFFGGVLQTFPNPHVPGYAVTAWGLAVSQLFDGEKNVLCIVHFACSSFVLVLVLVLIFPVLPY